MEIIFKLETASMKAGEREHSAVIAACWGGAGIRKLTKLPRPQKFTRRCRSPSQSAVAQNFCNLPRPLIKILFLLVPSGYIIFNTEKNS